MTLIRSAHEAAIRTDIPSLLKCVEPSLVPTVKAMAESLRQCRDVEAENIRLAKSRFRAAIVAKYGPDAFDPSDGTGHGDWRAFWCGFTPFPYSLPLTPKHLAMYAEKADWNLVKIIETGDKAAVAVKNRPVFCEYLAIRRLYGGWYITFAEVEKTRKDWIGQTEAYSLYVAYLTHLNQVLRGRKVRTYAEYEEEIQRYKERLKISTQPAVSLLYRDPE
jgi:hypothetical protein